MNHQLDNRFAEVASWKEGWLDGSGRIPERDALQTFREETVSTYPADLPLPGLALTAEGELVLEWHSPAAAVLDTDLSNNWGEFQAFPEELEQEIDFNSKQGWTILYALLSKTLS